MKPPRVKLPPLPIIITSICVLFFFLVLYAERLTFLPSSSSSFFKFKSCPRRSNKLKSSKSTSWNFFSHTFFSCTIWFWHCYWWAADKKAEEDKGISSFVDDRFDFDPEECNVANGKWVFNRSMKPLYTDRSCPYIDRQFSCVKNGREDSHYRHWEWQPEDCTLPK